MTIYRIGEASNPGPQFKTRIQTHKKSSIESNTNSGTIKVDFINISHFINLGETLLARDFDVAFLNEHSLPKHELHNARKVFGNKYRVELSKLDPEKSHNVGGVGMVQKGIKNIIMPKVKNKNLKIACEEGRVQLFGMCLNKHDVALVYVPYGYTGGEQNILARTRTNELCTFILQDMEEQVEGPKFIMGDLNATTLNLASIQDAILEGKIIDIGANSIEYGVPNNSPTCCGNNTEKGN